jgi:hypothetical protein
LQHPHRGISLARLGEGDGVPVQSNRIIVETIGRRRPARDGELAVAAPVGRAGLFMVKLARRGMRLDRGAKLVVRLGHAALQFKG